MNDVNSQLGAVNISHEVLASIAGNAATECYGLVGMASRTLRDGIAELLGRDAVSTGVEVKVDGDQVVIELYIIVEYGVRISEVARNIQERVKYSVEDLTGRNVNSVNVNVQGVRVGGKQTKGR
jgi:uncharacterized alkaline shock family protein YloU